MAAVGGGTCHIRQAPAAPGHPAPPPAREAARRSHLRDTPAPWSAGDVLLLFIAGTRRAGRQRRRVASVASYPALLAVGLGPVHANVTNTVALIFSSVGSVAGSRVELEGQAASVKRLAGVSVVGGLGGAGLLLITDPETFERIAPWLIGLASLTIPLRGRLRSPVEGERLPADRPLVLAGTLLVGIYAGYFGAAAGVVLLAMLLATTHDSLPRTNALKNAVLGLGNGAAAVGFAIFGPVEWIHVPALAAGLLAGARLGPVIVRRADPAVLRTIIAVGGVALAIRLGIDAY